MPELPEVETVCRSLISSILKQPIVTVIVRQFKLRHPIPKNLPKILRGKFVEKISRRGKYILLGTKTGTLIIHLGMSGNLQIKPQNHPIIKHDHVEIILNNNLALCYNDPRRFGAILWTNQDPLKHPLLKKLGPEPFAKEFTAAYLFDQAKSSQGPIKQFIMNNHIVTGVGNIYANEALFAAKINPLQKAKQLSLCSWQTLVKEIKKLLRRAIKYGGTTIKDHQDSHGKKGSFQNKLKIYGRANQPCYNCNTKLTRIKIGQRSTIFCPQCQKQ